MESFGSVPFQETLYEPPYVGPQLSPDEVYAQIIKDVDASIASFKEAGVKYSTNGGANSGRASLAAALMLKLVLSCIRKIMLNIETLFGRLGCYSALFREE